MLVAYDLAGWHNRKPTSLNAQATLFDAGLPAPDVPHVQVARSAPRTSIDAARLALPKSGTARFKVLAAIANAPDGMTDHQIVARTLRPINVVNPRRGELVDLGWIVDGGERRDWNGHVGIVWVLTSDGKREWARRSA